MSTAWSRSVSRMIPFVNDTQSVEGEPRLDVLDVLGVGGDEPGQPAGGDHGRLAELVEDARDDAVDLRGEAVEHAGLDRLDGRAAR